MVGRNTSSALLLLLVPDMPVMVDPPSLPTSTLREMLARTERPSLGRFELTDEPMSVKPEGVTVVGGEASPSKAQSIRKAMSFAATLAGIATPAASAVAEPNSVIGIA